MKYINLEEYTKWRSINPEVNFKYLGIRQNMSSYLGIDKVLSVRQVFSLEMRYISKKLKKKYDL